MVNGGSSVWCLEVRDVGVSVSAAYFFPTEVKTERLPQAACTCDNASSEENPDMRANYEKMLAT